MMHFVPRLCSAHVSTNIMNPGETVWVTLRWQANAAAPQPYRFGLRAAFGHQRRLENRRYDFAVEAEAYPCPTLWKLGDVVAVTIHWRNLSDWSGTYHLSVCMLDAQGVLVPFIGADGRETRVQYVGDVDVSWNLGRPWVAAHRKAYDVDFYAPEAVAPVHEVGKTREIGEALKVTLAQCSPAIRAIGAYPLAYGEPIVTVRNRETSERGMARATFTCISHSAVEARYHCEVRFAEALAATCVVALSVMERTLRVTVEQVQEMDGYELLAVTYPSLAELHGGYLVDFFGAGRLIPTEEATPICYTKRYDVRNAAALYDDHTLLLVESVHMDSMLTTGVMELNGRKAGVIGGGITLRVPAEKPGLPSIPVKTPPVFTVEMPALDGAAPSWQLAAKLLRRGLKPGKHAALYNGAYVYKQLATFGPLPQEQYRSDPYQTTQNLFRTLPFEEIADNVRRFANMTDGMRQVVYVAGWQKGGFDTSFPEPYDAEARCGGLDGLRKALDTMRQYNALSGLHDNFDDIDASQFPAYPHTALDEYGERWRGWIWAGGQTHIMGFGKYVRSGAMDARVQKMTELLPLRGTYHIDVLTAEPCRYDFDPAAPASVEDSFRAKMAVVEAFDRRGIDVTSEMLTHPAVGKIGYALHTRLDTKDVLIPGERFIPLVQMIYHGYTGYSAPSHSTEQMLWGLLLGAHTFHEEDITGPLSISRYYTQNLPAMLLDGKPMTAFTQEGSRACAEYGDGNRVEVDFAAQTYRVYVDDVLVGKDFTTLAQGPKGYLAYAFEGSLSGYTLPKAFDNAQKLRLTCLTPEGDGEAWEMPKPEGEWSLSIPVMTPVRVEGI